jgi:pantoate--beta-alanine ligase
MRIIEKMAKDLNFPTKIIPCPIVREEGGLALSSRNIFLSPTQKINALEIRKTLQGASEDFKTKSINQVLQAAIKKLENIKEAKIDYAQIVDFYDLSSANKMTKKAAFLVAIWIGKTRLIDNIVMTRKIND